MDGTPAPRRGRPPRARLWIHRFAAAGALLLAASGAPAQQVDWSGIYGGVQAGYGEARAASATTAGLGFFAPPPVGTGGQASGNAMAQAMPNVSTRPYGLLAGGHLGYNWQRARLVYGLEADIQATHISGSAAGGGAAQITGFPADSINAGMWRTDTLDYLSLWRARLGYSFGNFLPFVTAGLALGQVRSQAVLNENFVGPTTTITTNLPAVSSVNSVQVGWTIGTGLEYALGAHWRLRADYSYYDLGSQKNHVATTSRFTTPPPGVFTSAGADIGTRWTGNLWRVGVSYRF